MAATCPRCGDTYTEPAALSRADNATGVCPTCGHDEAIGGTLDRAAWPVVPSDEARRIAALRPE